MPLSIHFYNLAEVSAALAYRITNGDVLESLFWCNELIQSGCATDAISILFETWVFQKGPFALSWLISAFELIASEEVTEEAILTSCYQLRYAGSIDHSIWHILQMTVKKITPDRLSSKRPPMFPSDDPTEQYFITALYQHRAYTAWHISLQIPADRVWELLDLFCKTDESIRLLKKYDMLLGYRSEAYDIIILCVAVLTACLSEKQIATSCKPVGMNQDILTRIAEWPFGCMSARLYTIPAAGLYGTERSTYKWSDTRMEELNSVESGLIGCPYWEDALSNHAVIDKDTNTINWISDTLKERFYQRYFPDDIPDEWTAVEKRKSHGQGLLGPREPPHTLLTYSKKYLSKTARFTFDSMKFDDILVGLVTTPVGFVEKYITNMEFSCKPVLPSVRRRFILA
jgi:hypothetical protein